MSEISYLDIYSKQNYQPQLLITHTSQAWWSSIRLMWVSGALLSSECPVDYCGPMRVYIRWEPICESLTTWSISPKHLLDFIVAAVTRPQSRHRKGTPRLVFCCRINPWNRNVCV